MELSFSDEDEQFRTELRAWLSEYLPAAMRDPSWWRGRSAASQFAIRREWEAKKAAAGYCGIQWPTEFGGRGGTPTMKAIYDEEMAKANAPATVNPLGLAFLGPTVMAIGTEEQKRDIIKPLLHAETIWCQGFSEPGAGSDLAALQMKAELQGDHYVLNGQKTWTSNAMHGDKIFALARTGPREGTRHAGISMLLVDMHQAGVEVRPLRKLTGDNAFGENDFGEVFFTDAVCPQSEVLGGPDNGWSTAMLLLSFERGSSAIAQYTEFRQQWDHVAQLAADLHRDGRPAALDPVLRQRLADSVIDLECLKYHSWHVLTATSQGKDLGYEASMTKMMWSETFRKVSDTYEAVTGTSFQVDEPTPGQCLSELTTMALRSRSTTIWGGSAQVQRTIVAERVLGLPR